MKRHLVKNIAWSAAVVIAFVAGMAIKGMEAPHAPATNSKDSTGGRGYLSALNESSDKGAAGTGAAGNSGPGSPILDKDGALLNSTVADKFRSALAEPDPVRRMGLVAEMLGRLGADDAEDILAAFGHQWRMGDYQQEFKMFLHAWGEIDGARAVEYALDSNSPVRIDRGGRSAIAGWAAADLGSAMEWVEALEPGQRRNAMVYGLLDGWSRTDLAAAGDYVESQPRSNERTGMIDLLLSRHLEQGGIESATDWFAGISGEDHNATYQARAFYRISEEMAREDPAAAAGWIDRHAGESYVTADVLRNVASEWGKVNPEEAMAWVMGSSQENLEGPVLGVMESWSSRDPAAAADWLRDQSGEPYYDSAVNTYVKHLQETDPELAMQWAESISKEEQRRHAVESVARRWLQADNETARANLIAQGMAEEQIERLMANGGAADRRVWRVGGQGNQIDLGSITFSTDIGSTGTIILNGGSSSE